MILRISSDFEDMECVQLSKRCFVYCVITSVQSIEITNMID